MKIAFLAPSVSRALGGIYEVERHLATALTRADNAEVEVVGLEDEYTQEDRPTWSPIEPHVLTARGPAAFGYAPGMVDTLHRLEVDLVHLHALWTYTSIATLRWKRRTQRPHIVTVHGMLDPWAVKNSRWKKRFAGWFYENANLRQAACLHVFTEAEQQAVRAYGIDVPVCIIPNGVRLPKKQNTRPAPWANAIAPDRKVLLFLGRIHPKKGLAELVSAWANVKQATDGWALAVVGWDDGGHLPALQHQVQAAGLDRDVHLLGPMFGPQKEAAFHHADAFVLPSYSEGVPMAVLEAWAYRLPVLMSTACNLPSGVEHGAAIEVVPDPASIADGLEQLFALTKERRLAMGHNGRRLVEQCYTWSRVASQIHEVYKWVLGERNRPACVRID